MIIITDSCFFELGSFCSLLGIFELSSSETLEFVNSIDSTFIKFLISKRYYNHIIYWNLLLFFFLFKKSNNSSKNGRITSQTVQPIIKSQPVLFKFNSSINKPKYIEVTK